MRATPTPKHSAEEFACASLFTTLALGAPTADLREPSPTATVKTEEIESLLESQFGLPADALASFGLEKTERSLSVHDLTKLILDQK